MTQPRHLEARPSVKTEAELEYFPPDDVDPDPFAPPAPVARRGRAAAANPVGRYPRLEVELDEEAVNASGGRAETKVYRDTSRSALSKNSSPDIPFDYSLNPYRGCEHGCAYCYARPSHEYLGFSAGLDFETKIVAKPDLPQRLAETFQKASWKPAVISLSGNTDPYQPLDRKLEITRRCLEVFLRHRNPVAIITKNALINRDIDILAEMATMGLVKVAISITTLRDEIAGAMEPRTSRPKARLAAIESLADAGIPVGVNVAPVIPGLTDEEVPAILEAAARAGATSAGFMSVRLPGAVSEIFQEWIWRSFPDRAERVLNRIRETHGGQLNDPRLIHRMHAEGAYAAALRHVVKTTCLRLGLERRRSDLSTSHFRRLAGGQADLFEFPAAKP